MDMMRIYYYDHVDCTYRQAHKHELSHTRAPKTADFGERQNECRQKANLFTHGGRRKKTPWTVDQKRFIILNNWWLRKCHSYGLQLSSDLSGEVDLSWRGAKPNGWHIHGAESIIRFGEFGICSWPFLLGQQQQLHKSHSARRFIRSELCRWCTFHPSRFPRRLFDALGALAKEPWHTKEPKNPTFDDKMANAYCTLISHSRQSVSDYFKLNSHSNIYTAQRGSMRLLGRRKWKCERLPLQSITAHNNHFSMCANER